MFLSLKLGQACLVNVSKAFLDKGLRCAGFREAAKAKCQVSAFFGPSSKPLLSDEFAKPRLVKVVLAGSSSSTLAHVVMLLHVGTI